MDNFFDENAIEDRKLALFAEASNYEYQFALEDAFIYSTSIEEYNMMVEDAEEKMEKASGNFFTRLSESIVKFFAKLGEKMEERRKSKATEKMKKKLAELPELNNKRVEVPDFVYLKNACEGDTKLCQKLVKMYLSGKLTEDILNRELAKSYLKKTTKDKKKKIVTTIAKAVAIVGGAAGAAFAIYKYRDKLQGMIDELKKSKDKVVDKYRKVKAVKEAPANAVNKGKEIIGKGKVAAENLGSKITEVVKNVSQEYNNTVNEISNAVSSAISGKADAVAPKLNATTPSAAKKSLSEDDIDLIQSRLHKLNPSVDRHKSFSFKYNGQMIQVDDLSKYINRKATSGHIDEANFLIDKINKATSKK